MDIQEEVKQKQKKMRRCSKEVERRWYGGGPKGGALPSIRVVLVQPPPIVSASPDVWRVPSGTALWGPASKEYYP